MCPLETRLTRKSTLFEWRLAPTLSTVQRWNSLRCGGFCVGRFFAYRRASERVYRYKGADAAALGGIALLAAGDRHVRGHAGARPGRASTPQPHRGGALCDRAGRRRDRKRTGDAALRNGWPHRLSVAADGGGVAVDH